jgi:hypothetical protein
MTLFELCVTSILENKLQDNVPAYLQEYVELNNEKAIVERFKSNNMYLVDYHANKLLSNNKRTIVKACGGLKYYLDKIDINKFPLLKNGVGYIDSFRYIILLTSDYDGKYTILREAFNEKSQFGDESSLEFLQKIYYFDVTDKVTEKIISLFININVSTTNDECNELEVAKENCILQNLYTNNIKLL